MHPGLAHSIHRAASTCESGSERPQFTSSKQRLRSKASASGMRTRGMAIRSFRDSPFFSGMLRLLCIRELRDIQAQRFQLLLLCR